MIGKTAWPHLLADLIEKRDALTHIIEIVQTQFVDDEDDAAEAIPTPAVRRAVRARRGRPRKQATASSTPRRAARTTRDETRRDDERRATILALLETGPLATRDVATKLKLDRILTKMTLQRMKKVGLVTSTGVTSGQRWALPGRESEPEVAAVKPHDFGPTKELAIVDARDQAVLRYLRLHHGVAEAEDLKAAMPQEPALTNDQALTAFRSALVRLKAKGVIDRTGTRWHLVGAPGSRVAHG